MSKRGSTKTLDTHHNSKITQFQTQQEVMEEKQRQLAEVKDKIATMTQVALSNLSEPEFQTYLSLVDERSDLEKEIVAIKKSATEINYYVENADIIFKYYDIVENGNIAENETAAAVTENSILKFFSASIEKNGGKHNEPSALQDRKSVV